MIGVEFFLCPGDILQILMVRNMGRVGKWALNKCEFVSFVLYGFFAN